MASMRDIKRRRESISSTGQITKAMKLVSTVKLQKAKQRAESTKPYFNQMYATVCSMLKKSGNLMHSYIQGNNVKKKAVIVITSNRGLAGGYNSNVVKLVTGSGMSKEDTVIYAMGHKGRDWFSRHGYDVRMDYSEAMNEPLFKDAQDVGREVLKAYLDNEIGEIYVAYTVFKNTVSHIPTLLKLLPIDQNMVVEGEAEIDEIDKLTLMNYEPDAEEALTMIIPKYINSLIYGAMVEAMASENGARMQAMDSATSNAEDMISDLELKYNRARQSSITQEITEIIGGANAIS